MDLTARLRAGMILPMTQYTLMRAATIVRPHIVFELSQPR